MKKTLEKGAACGEWRVVCDGKCTDVIRRSQKGGYDKFVVLENGKLFRPPCFSHFPTLAAVKRFCGVE